MGDFSDLDKKQRAEKQAQKPAPQPAGKPAPTFRDTDFKPVTMADLRKAGITKAPDPKAKRSLLEEVSGAVNTLNRSIPFVDEAGDAIQAGIDLASGRADTPAGAWDAARARSRQSAEDFQRRRPIAASQFKGAGYSAQIVPALLSGGATALPAAETAGGNLLAKVGQALTGPFAKSAYTGAATSAVMGYADDGSLKERMDAGNAAAGPGALWGAGLHGAAKLGGPLADLVVRRFAPAEERATARAGRILAARVPEARNVRGNATNEPGRLPFQDMGPGARSLARAVANTPGPGQEIARTSLRDARSLAGPRMLQAAQDELGDNGSSLYRTLDELDTVRQTQAEPLYAEGYAHDMSNEGLTPLLSRPSMRKALARGERIAEEQGRNPSALGFRRVTRQMPGGGRVDELVEVENPTPQTWDYIKRGLDDVLETYRDKTTGRLVLDEEGRAVLATLNALKKEIRAANPKLAEAWDAWSGPTKAMEAAKRGRGIVTGRTDPEQISATGETYTPAQVDAQRYGMARGLSDMLRSGSPRRAVNRMNTDEVLQDRLRAGWMDDASFDRFSDRARQVAGDLDDFAAIDQGSRTTPLAEDIAAANDAAGEGAFDQVAAAGARRLAGQSFRNQLGGLALRIGEAMRSPGLRDETTHRILGEVLFKGRSPEEVLRAAVAQRALTPEQAQQMLPLLTRAVAQNQQQPITSAQ